MKTMRTLFRALTAAALMAATTSCGSVVRSSRSPVILVIDQLLGLRGQVTTSVASSNLISDVHTLVTSGGVCTTASPCPTVFGDTGQAQIHLVLKDIGLPGTTPTATTNNAVTIDRVHVAYRRTDGRNQEGVDIPYAFDTAVTATVPSSGSNVTFGFPLVRVQAKVEAPLAALVTNGQILSMIAEVTFYGQDTVGNSVTVAGAINVDFGNFGDN